MELHLGQTTPIWNASLTPRPLVIATLTRLHYHRGEQRLMLAVLLDAISTIECYDTGRGTKIWGDCQAAVQWVRAQDRNWPFSFENICSALDLNSDKLRAALSAEFPALFFRVTHVGTFRPKASVNLQPAQA